MPGGNPAVPEVGALNNLLLFIPCRAPERREGIAVLRARARRSAIEVGRGDGVKLGGGVDGAAVGAAVGGFLGSLGFTLRLTGTLRLGCWLFLARITGIDLSDLFLRVISCGVFW